MMYRVESRIAGTGLWHTDGGDCDLTSYPTRAEAEEAMADLEPTNDDGDELEYRVVEAQS